MIGKRELTALLSLSSWCLVIVMLPQVFLQFVIVVFLDHTHLLLFITHEVSLTFMENKLSWPG